MHGDIVSNVRENLHYLDVSIFNHILSGRETMLKLKKYFKKYWLLFVLAIVCIFGQAYTELTLPDYMSDIVSSGIQAGGFDSAVSPVLSEETYNHLLLFVSSKDQKVLENAYKKTLAKDVDKSYYKTFKKAKNQTLYILKKDVDEVHAVYFKHNKEISKQVFKDCNNGEIFFADDLLQHAWRDRLKKRFEDKVVSKAAVLLNVSRNKEESEESITNKLSALGIKVDDFVPEFTREELKVFYSQIDKWWDEFCDDIHFADPEDDIYRQEMKDLIRNPKYKWAFEYK